MDDISGNNLIYKEILYEILDKFKRKKKLKFQKF